MSDQSRQENGSEFVKKKKIEQFVSAINDQNNPEGRIRAAEALGEIG
jgi:hypothetical protein